MDHCLAIPRVSRDGLHCIAIDLRNETRALIVPWCFIAMKQRNECFSRCFDACFFSQKPPLEIFLAMMTTLFSSTCSCVSVLSLRVPFSDVVFVSHRTLSVRYRICHFLSPTMTDIIIFISLFHCQSTTVPASCRSSTRSSPKRK